MKEKNAVSVGLRAASVLKLPHSGIPVGCRRHTRSIAARRASSRSSCPSSHLFVLRDLVLGYRYHESITVTHARESFVDLGEGTVYPETSIFGTWTLIGDFRTSQLMRATGMTFRSMELI